MAESDLFFLTDSDQGDRLALLDAATGDLQTHPPLLNAMDNETG
jgi:hypothetical protein